MGIDTGAKGSSMATINVVPLTDILLVLVAGTGARFAQSLTGRRPASRTRASGQQHRRLRRLAKVETVQHRMRPSVSRGQRFQAITRLHEL